MIVGDRLLRTKYSIGEPNVLLTHDLPFECAETRTARLFEIRHWWDMITSAPRPSFNRTNLS